MHSFKWWWGAGGGVLPDKGIIFAPFGLKTGRDFAHFGQESGMVFEGSVRT